MKGNKTSSSEKISLLNAVCCYYVTKSKTLEIVDQLSTVYEIIYILSFNFSDVHNLSIKRGFWARHGGKCFNMNTWGAEANESL